MSASDFAEKVRSGEISAEESTARVLEKAKKIDSKLACFINICEERALESARKVDARIKKGEKGKLLGVPISVKDNVCVSGVETTAGSAILRGYVPPFSATSIEQIEREGGIVIGKTSMDEFGFGGFSVNIGNGFRTPKNPLDEKRCTGGSSGGSGAITAAFSALGVDHISLAESTGGSITSPACFCGVVGITPTYGRVSRWGLVDYASSLDKIGSIGKDVHDAALLLEIAQGRDERDMTSRPEKGEPLSALKAADAKRIRIGVPKEFFEGVNPQVSDLVWKRIKLLEKEGAKIEEISLPTAKFAVPCYYIIAMSEASTNLAKFNGTRYGLQKETDLAFNQYFSEIRAQGFSEEAKRRAILGTFARMSGYRGKFYLRAMKVRTKIINEFESAFAKYDAIIAPSMPILPPTFEEIANLSPMENYALDMCTTPPNLAGIPHVSLPIGKINGLPVGCQVMCGHLQEKKAVEISLLAEALE